MGDSESSFEEAALPVKRGRPQGKADSTQRTRRTAQEISDDKVRVAQMKLDALKEAEEKSWLIEKCGPSSSSSNGCILCIAKSSEEAGGDSR